MPGILKIEDTNGLGYLSFDIANLLALVPEEGAKWSWRLFSIGEGTEITGGRLPFSDLTVGEFAYSVDASEEGISLSWEMLNTFAATVHQTIWGTYIACQYAAYFPLLKSLYQDDWGDIDDASEEYYQLVEVAFQAIDSSYWLVYSKNDDFLQRITQTFHDVKVLRKW